MFGGAFLTMTVTGTPAVAKSDRRRRWRLLLPAARALRRTLVLLVAEPLMKAVVLGWPRITQAESAQPKSLASATCEGRGGSGQTFTRFAFSEPKLHSVAIGKFGAEASESARAQQVRVAPSGCKQRWRSSLSS